MTSWYAVYTLSGWEKKVAESLSKRGFENFCPLIKDNYYKKNRKEAFTPLFKSYVFVKMNEQQISHVKKINGVVNLLYWLEEPIKIKEIEVEMIKRFLIEHKNIRLEKTNVTINSIVKISSGSVMEKEARGISEDYDMIKLQLPSIGYQLITKVKKEIEDISSFNLMISGLIINSESEVAI